MAVDGDDVNGDGAHAAPPPPPPPPSLLRIGLSAGFSSLSERRRRSSSGGAQQRRESDESADGGDSDGGMIDPDSLLSSPEEERRTSETIRRAIRIGQKRSVGVVDENDERDPLTMAALTALGGECGDFSHAGKGVLVNVIDPTSSSPSGGGGSAATNGGGVAPPPPPPPQQQMQQQADTPEKGGKGGFFGGFGGGNKTSSAANSANNDVANNGSSSHGEPNHYDASSLRAYQKLSATFRTNYDSTLHSLPFAHPRTGVRSSVPSLPVRLGLGVQPVGDPAEWHDGPYCHVYVAAAADVEHYRARVRPALRAWVNQIEGSGVTTVSTPSGPAPKGLSKASPGAPAGPGSPIAGGKGGKKTQNEKALARAGLAAGKAVAAGNFGSRYVIVFVPIGGGGGGSAPGGSAGGKQGAGSGGGGGGFGGFRGRKGGQAAGGGGVVLSSSQQSDANASSGAPGLDDSQSAGTGTTASSTAGGGSGSTIDPSYHSAQHSAALPPGPVSHNSKEVKELYHKMVKDFPNGRTVILGTLGDDGPSPLKNQEWKAFLHNLGGAIVDGFRDRVRRYDEELRRLDARRAAFVRKLSNDSLGPGGGGAGGGRPPAGGANRDDFDLSHFFLVKESLAFTYEQMQLFEEAKLQYEELAAFLPEDAWRALAQRRGRGGGDEREDRYPRGGHPSDLAMAGDGPRFRSHVRDSGRDLGGVSRYVPWYMYAREVRLLFLMGDPVAALHRSADFLASAHRERLVDVRAKFARRWREQIEAAGVDCDAEEILARREALRGERLGREARAEAWALSSAWDVRCAAARYFNFENDAGAGNARAKRGVGGEGGASRTVEEVEAARCLAELLEFAMLRLMRLGDLSLSHEGGGGEGGGDGTTTPVNPIRRATSERPADTLRPWEPWRSLKRAREEVEARHRARRSREKKDARRSILHKRSGGAGADGEDRGEDEEAVATWLLEASSPSSRYELTYLELAGAAASLNRLAGRHRSASRLEDQRAEVLIARGEHSRAARVLTSGVAGVAAQDQWTRAHYWRIFRLACCQRMSGDVLAYLETLTQSFNPKLKAVAPPKTASLFQRDLEAIITDAAVAEPRWGAFPFLETELSIAAGEEGAEVGGRSTMPLPFLRRKLTKNLCFVGDRLKFSLRIKSHLPRPIAVNGLRLYLVTLDQFEVVYRRNGIVGEDDAFRILAVDPPIHILPGDNEYSFEWRPMTYDTYVLATVEIQWKEASFFYDSALLRKPMMGMDVQPSEPTQTIELNPLFLIPGHVQNVRLVFHSGSDVITEGRVRLICSRGLMVVPPRTDPSKLDGAWSSECVIPLDACGPGKKVVITTLVKSSTIKHDDAESVQTMRAVVETRYRQESYDAVMREGEEPESDPMNTLLEAMVTTLDRPALAVDDARAFVFGDDHVMVNISLQCNSPVPFYIKEWHLDLPPPLRVEEDGDLNRDMFRHAIPEGEVLLLGFRCVRIDSFDAEENVCERPLLRVVLQDDFGKTFLQVLPVNLEEIYRMLRKEDVYAELYTATAELTCSSGEGTVGHPVPFAYDLNLQSLMTPRQRRNKMGGGGGGGGSASVSSVTSCPILYTIISDGSDWIVSGKVQGLINLGDPDGGSSEEGTLRLNFRGIPTQSGMLRNFPELYLEYLPAKSYKGPPAAGGNGTSSSAFPPITVQCKNPDCFQSYAYTTSLSLAVPATLDEF